MNNRKFGKKDFHRKENFRPISFSKKRIEEIIFSSEGNFEITGRVNRVILTAGPTVFAVSDGTGTLQLKG
ncbi:MAG: hypothetical protein M1165_01685, partial [Candidatus Pacearchaeota archaeon]|nr:hypothetical protein [Candidatus Pacearchaeota archaeon]